MTIESEQKQLIDSLQVWLEENLASYSQATKILLDPDQVRNFVKSLAVKMSGALRFDPYTHPAEAAVAEIAKLQERLGGVLEDIDFLDEYEEKKKRYTDAIRAFVKAEPKGDPSSQADESEAL